jgi:Flp pilus assembly pilin Flp
MLEQIGLRIAMALNGTSTPLRREEGQTLVEYALIIVTISIGVTLAMVFLKDRIAAVFSRIGSAL